MNYKILIAAALAAAVVEASTVEEQLPEGWFKNGSAVQECQAGVDTDLAASGTANITLKCDTDVTGFVSFMQQFSAEAYRGNRLRYSAWVKADGVGGWGGLWMRVDEVLNRETAAFDNMQNRLIKDTRDWQRYDIVLDVAPTAEAISIGMLLSEGRGQLWVRDMQLEVVGSNTPVTDLHTGQRRLPLEPVNLQLIR
ncbi:MAG: hypothetical protein GX539_00020 [Candidatus Cloacimonetes bacterium]|nr:hypothetical protein [Candidatus Cloacimonadota bacterium]